MVAILWFIAAVIVAIWLLGWLAFHVGGSAIHLLLILVAIIVIYNLITGRRSV